MHFISGTVEGNDARQSCGRVTNLNAHRFLFGHIIVMAHNCSWKMSSLRWLMSYLTHWDQCPRPYQQQIGYFESQRKALQLVLSQHWVKPLDRGIYHYYFMIMDFEAVERVQLGHSMEMNGWHQMLEKGIKRKSYRPLWSTNTTELLYTSKNSSECQRPIANMKKQQDGYSILPMLANMATRLWLFIQMTQIFFVMSLMFQYKISVLLIKQFGTKTMVDLLTLQNCGHYWYLGKPVFHITYSHRMSHSIFWGHGKIIIFIFLTSNKEIMDDSHDLDQN